MKKIDFKQLKKDITEYNYYLFLSKVGDLKPHEQEFYDNYKKKLKGK